MSYVAMKGITKKFNNLTVLKNVDFSVEKGQFATLLGPSGCGKSTLLRILSGLTEPDSGTVMIDDQDVTKIDPRLRQIGMVFQNYALFPNMTVAQNVAFGLEIQKKNIEEIKREVRLILELVELTDKHGSYPRELSGGQQQRVALARSLVTKPKVLLLDEPLSALDAKIRKTLRNQLRSIQKELSITTVMVTHDQEEAMSISDRIHVMDIGTIAQSGTPHEVYTRPRNAFVARFMGNYNVLPASMLRSIAPRLEETAAQFALRPETLYEQPFENSIALPSQIMRVSMLGNIIQYELSACGERILCERLHHQQEMDSQEGQFKTFYINPAEIIPLEKTAAGL